MADNTIHILYHIVLDNHTASLLHNALERRFVYGVVIHQETTKTAEVMCYKNRVLATPVEAAEVRMFVEGYLEGREIALSLPTPTGRGTARTHCSPHR